jgi:hypothetical protein
MRILWVATKPPWPPADGGRLLQVLTLQSLAAQGHAITLVAPAHGAPATLEALQAPLRQYSVPHLVAVPARRVLPALVRASWRRVPVSVALHQAPAVRDRVAALLDTGAYDVVHAEQLQALAQCQPALRRGVPVVLRCQNVESDLWQGLAERSGLLRPLLRREAARLARWEGRALRTVRASVALTEADAERLCRLGGDGCAVHRVAAPFPPWLPAAQHPLEGQPAVVVLGDDAWRPNRDGAAWFTRQIWPRVLQALPGAVLHRYGGGQREAPARGVVLHASPEDSREAFPASGAVLVVPLRYASGVRMKILEAWARGTPVVATPQAAAGLDAGPGTELLLAHDAQSFCAALDALHRDPALARVLVHAGRARLQASHDPATIADRLGRIYASSR